MEQNTFAEGQGQSASSIGSSGSTQTPAERTFVQSDLDAVAGRVRNEERAAAEKRFQAHIQSVQPNHTSQVMQGNAVASNSPALTVEEARRIADEQYEKRRKEDHEKQVQYHAEQENQRLHNEGMRIANEFKSSLESQKHKYSDFDQQVGQMSLSQYPMTIGLSTVNYKDNVADIMYELQKNPAKMHVIETMAQRDPEGAKRELGMLVSSIKANETAQSKRTANAPLSQIQPSTLGTANGTLSMRDLKKNPRLRG